MPPSTSGTPHRRQNTPKVALVSATRRSHQIASSSPPATAWPWTAAITGLRSVMRVMPIGPSPVVDIRFASVVPTALRLAPAQKDGPLPASTATNESDASNSRNAEANSPAIAPSTAL